MNIAFVSNVMYPFVKGGTEKRIYEIGRRLAAYGHEVTVYSRHWWDGPPTIDYEGMQLVAVSQPRKLFTGSRRSITEALGFAKDILKSLRTTVDEHDVVVANTSGSGYFATIAAGLVTIFESTHFITTWHEIWGRYWIDYLGALAPFGWSIERLTANLPQTPVAVSKTTADQLSRISPSRKTIEVIPNGIDVDQVNSVPPADNGFDILFVGRLIPEKNVDLLLQAFDQISGEFNVTLGIIGDGPEVDTLRQQAQSMAHSDQISFLGFLEDHRDVLAHMKAAKLFVSPSIREGFGITYLEAMANNCRVIGIDHPRSAAAEVIGDCGAVIDDSVPALVEAMQSTLQDDGQFSDPVTRANQFDWDRIAKQTEDFYSKICEESSSTMQWKERKPSNREVIDGVN